MEVLKTKLFEFNIDCDQKPQFPVKKEQAEIQPSCDDLPVMPDKDMAYDYLIVNFRQTQEKRGPECLKQSKKLLS